MKGLFYGIGHKPNSGILGGQVELHDNGYVKVRWRGQDLRASSCAAVQYRSAAPACCVGTVVMVPMPQCPSTMGTAAGAVNSFCEASRDGCHCYGFVAFGGCA